MQGTELWHIWKGKTLLFTATEKPKDGFQVWLDPGTQTLSELNSFSPPFRSAFLFHVFIPWWDAPAPCEGKVASSNSRCAFYLLPTLSDFSPKRFNNMIDLIHHHYDWRLFCIYEEAMINDRSKIFSTTLCEEVHNYMYNGGGLVAKLCPTLATPWTVARQAPLSMEFSRQEYWSGLPFPSPGDLPNPGIEPGSPALQADALSSEPPGKPSYKAETYNYVPGFLTQLSWKLVSAEKPAQWCLAALLSQRWRQQQC